MTSRTLARKRTPNAEFATAVSAGLTIKVVYFQEAAQLLLDKFEAAPNLGLVSVNVGPFDEASETARFDGPELFFQASFANIPAFGIWSDRTESDEELLESLGSQWGGDESE